MKKTVSMLLAVLFALTAFGVSTLFGGVLGAGAVFYDYYESTQFPGLCAFNADDYALAWKNCVPNATKCLNLSAKLKKNKATKPPKPLWPRWVN